MVSALKRGLTIGEVVVAFGLLSVAVLALMSLFGGGLRLSGQVKHTQTATQLARSLLEKLQSGAVVIPVSSSFSGQPAVDDFPPPPYPRATVNEVEYFTTVSTRPVSGAPGIVDVTVEVRWKGSPGVVLQTYFHQI